MSVSGTQHRVAGWYPDPADPVRQRWWDGEGWTARTSYAQPPQALGPGFPRLTRWLVRLLVFWALVSVTAVVLEFWGDLVWDRFIGGTDDFTVTDFNQFRDTFNHYLDMSRRLSWVSLATNVVTGLVWVVWQRRLALSNPGTRTPSVLYVWWGLWIVSSVLQTLWQVLRWNVNDPWGVGDVAPMRVIEASVTVVAAVFAVVVVRRLSRRALNNALETT